MTISQSINQSINQSVNQKWKKTQNCRKANDCPDWKSIVQ